MHNPNPKLNKLSKLSKYSNFSSKRSSSLMTSVNLHPVVRCKTVQQRQHQQLPFKNKSSYHYYSPTKSVLFDSEQRALRKIQYPPIKRYYKKHNIQKFGQILQKRFKESMVSQFQGGQLDRFRVIGVFDKKIIIGYNEELSQFGYFDQHAMHERIRYQYYREQLKKQEDNIQQYELKQAKDNSSHVGVGTKDSKQCFQQLSSQSVQFSHNSQPVWLYSTQHSKSNIFEKGSEKWDTGSIQRDRDTPIPVISRVKHCYMKFNINSKLSNSITVDSCGNQQQHSLRKWTAKEKEIRITKHGFKIRWNKQESTLYIDEIPQLLGRSIESKLIINIALDILRDPQHLSRSLDEAIAQISCKSAFKFSDRLSLEQCSSLIKNLSLCKHPFSCVHGRPTFFFAGEQKQSVLRTDEVQSIDQSNDE